jgi:hypothetical protein
MRDVIALREMGADPCSCKFPGIGKTPAIMVLPHRSLEEFDNKQKRLAEARRRRARAAPKAAA